MGNLSTVVYNSEAGNVTGLNQNILNFSTVINLTAATTYNLYAVATYTGNCQFINDYFSLKSVRIG